MKHEHFPSKVNGICPLGHNLAPSGDTANEWSDTQISAGEERPLFWSSYWQKYVCRMHLDKVKDEKHQRIFHQEQLIVQKKLSSMGFTNG